MSEDSSGRGFEGTKSPDTWRRQMLQRGWTQSAIEYAIRHGRRFPSPNHVNPGNGATRHEHPDTGQSVVIDNVTGGIIHVGGPGFKY